MATNAAAQKVFDEIMNRANSEEARVLFKEVLIRNPEAMGAAQQLLETLNYAYGDNVIVTPIAGGSRIDGYGVGGERITIIRKD